MWVFSFCIFFLLSFFYCYKEKENNMSKDDTYGWVELNWYLLVKSLRTNIISFFFSIFFFFSFLLYFFLFLIQELILINQPVVATITVYLSLLTHSPKYLLNTVCMIISYSSTTRRPTVRRAVLPSDIHIHPVKIWVFSFFIFFFFPSSTVTKKKIICPMMTLMDELSWNDTIC